MPPPNLTATQLRGGIVHHPRLGASYVCGATPSDGQIYVLSLACLADSDWIDASSVTLLIPKSDLLALADSIHQASQQVPHA